jgi:hypothetical protein
LHRDETYILLKWHANAQELGFAPVIVAKEPAAKPPFRLKLAGMVMRALFLMVLIAITARAASPQVENIRSIFETPGDIFIPPRDPNAYATWLYLGPALLPLAVLCAVVIW